MKNEKKLKIDKMPPPWNNVYDIAEMLPDDSWLLVGGLMVQARVWLAGLESRSTTDIDMLINVMASSSSVSENILAVLDAIGDGERKERRRKDQRG